MDVPTLYVNVVCLLILVPRSDERPSRQQHARFRSKHDMKDIIFQQNLIQEMKASRVGCASQCHIQATCKSYFYNKSSRRCRLHSTIFTDTTGAIPTEGWDYYGRHATSVKRNKAKTTTKTPGSKSSTLAPEDVSTTTDIPASVWITQSSENVRNSRGTTDERTFLEADPETTPSDTSTQKSRLLSTLATRHRSRTSSSTEMSGARENRLTSRMVTKPFVKLWAVTPESLPPGKLASMSTRDSFSTSEGGIKSEPGVRVTIRTTGNVMSSSRTSTSSSTTATSISSTSPTSISSTSSTTPTTDRDTTPIANKHFFEPVMSTSGNRSEDGTPSPSDDTPETDSSVAPRDTTAGNKGQVVKESDHNEDQHDEPNLLTTEDHAQLFELSTGLTVPSETTGDEDDEAGTITVMMVIGDDDDDESETTQFMMGTDVESTLSVISIGGDDTDHDHHQHILDHEVDDGGEVSSTTDVSTITPERGPQQERHAGKTTEEKSPYATLRLDKSLTNPGSTESSTSTATSIAGKVAAYVVLGVVLPLLGAVGYALYRRWRTGSWTLLHKQDDSLSLQLVSSTDGLTM